MREQFVARFELVDLDFDGHLDLTGVREFGAKWERYCVWLYDPKQHLFVKDFLSEQMELISNLRPLENRRIAASYPGPTNPWLTIYRIADVEEGRPQRQLVPVSSCVVETAPNGDSPSAVVMTRYEGIKPTTRREPATKTSLKEAFNQCADSPDQTREGGARP